MESIPPTAPTIKQIAQLSGASTSTVSRVLNRSGYVSETVRVRIEQVIRDTGYMPSSIAKDLKSQRSSMVGVIIPKINSFASSEIVAGISSVLTDKQYSVVLANTANTPKSELDYLHVFKQQRVCGILMLATDFTSEHLDTIRSMLAPVVITGQDVSEHGVPCVIQDERSAARQLTDYLIRCGHRRIGLIGVGDWDKQVGCERKAGYLEALAAQGLAPSETDIVYGGFDLLDGAAGADKLFPYSSDRSPTAILAVTDRLALGAMSRLMDRGIRVPGDVSVVGMGDIDISAVYRPKLTTVHYDYFKTGAAAASILVKRMQESGRDVERQVMPFELRVRESVATL